jgi:hypothetical protein
MFEEVIGVTAFQLTFQDSAGGVGADFGQRPYVDNVLHPGPETGFHRLPIAPFQERPQPSFGRFNGAFIELPPLKEVNVLAGNRGEIIASQLPSMKETAQQKGGWDKQRQ